MDLTKCSPEEWLQNEETYLNTLKQSSWKCFPSLNQVDTTRLKDGQLVRFRGMIQDMFNPEYYIDSCMSTNNETNERVMKHGKFREFIKLEDNESIDADDESTVHKDVQTYYVISTPGENQWVRDIQLEKNTDDGNISMSNSQKRSLEEDDTQMDVEVVVDDQATNQQKRLRNESGDQEIHNVINVSKDYLMNFPLEDKSGKACLIKVYTTETKIDLNDVCEFVGFLSIDPRLSQEYDSNQDSENNLETQLHNPPPSLIPRIHCVALKKLRHGNPLVEDTNIDIDMFSRIRKEIMIVLTQLLLGDEIAAEYLLCHLISEVYVRKDLMALGKFSLNLSNVPSDEELKYTEKLYEFLQLMLPKSHYFPLTIENMNNLTFIPKKDYDSNRLNSGLLQLSSNTELVLDETKLTPGELNQAGVSAVKEIANVIRSQKISYDFKFYPIEFDCDIPMLVLSEGKSMLPSDCHVVLKPDEEHLDTFNEIIEAMRHFLKPELLNEIRKYLTLCRLIKYDLEEGVHTLIQEKFVQMRRNSATSEDLHNLLVLNRLICLSYGRNTLDSRSLEIACKLEEKRKQRIVK